MIKKVIQSLKDPRILTAIGIGIVAPKILTILGKDTAKFIKMKKQRASIHVGIELGGTNYNVAIGKPEFDKKGNLIDFKLIRQASGRVSNKPDQTLKEIADTILIMLSDHEKVCFIGISCFGPLQLHKNSLKYGYITSTAKQGWRDVAVLDYFKSRIESQDYAIETDVNSAAFAELKLGNHKVKESLVYVTVGTGVGVGVICHNLTVHGLTHPQGGHIIVKRHPKEYQNFNGVCPFHKDCLQGMVANQSISKRTGVDFTKLHEIEDNEKIWQIVGYYLAQLCLNLTLTVSPQKIIIGGGILNRKILYKHIQQNFIQFLAQYVEHPLFTHENIHNYIVPPALGATVGVKGGLLLKHL